MLVPCMPIVTTEQHEWRLCGSLLETSEGGRERGFYLPLLASILSTTSGSTRGKRLTSCRTDLLYIVYLVWSMCEKVLSTKRRDGHQLAVSSSAKQHFEIHYPHNLNLHTRNARVAESPCRSSLLSPFAFVDFSFPQSAHTHSSQPSTHTRLQCTMHLQESGLDKGSIDEKSADSGSGIDHITCVLRYTAIVRFIVGLKKIELRDLRFPLFCCLVNSAHYRGWNGGETMRLIADTPQRRTPYTVVSILLEPWSTLKESACPMTIHNSFNSWLTPSSSPVGGDGT
jgi:hypothetical protein